MFDRRRLLRLKPMWVGIMGRPGKMPFRQRTKWSLIIYFGWLLAFPLQGPLLYSLAATAHYTNSNALGLLFIFFHALGLLSAGLYYFRKSFKKNILLASGLCSFFTSLAFLVVGPESWAFLLGLLGFSSGIYVIGWAYPYTICTVQNRTRFMAEVMIGANLIYYVINFLSSFTIFHPKMLLAALTASIILVAWFAPTLYPGAAVKLPQVKKFPVPLVIYLSLLTLVVYINGGLMYSIIFPSFVVFAQISRIYRLIPYLAVLFTVRMVRREWNKIDLFYISIVLLGLGFLSYIVFRASLTGYILTETFVLSGLALLDLGLWTLSADIAEVYGYIAGVFGATLTSNVVALHIGGLLGMKLVETADPYVKTSLIAFFIIFMTMAIIPGLGWQINRSLLSRKKELLDSVKATTLIIQELNRLSSEYLTPRETEIVGLIIEGCGNKEIASVLQISDNTVKAHVKNINRKIGVVNKNELLSLSVKILIQRHEEKTDIIEPAN